MPQRKLGNSNLQVSPIGLGCRTISKLKDKEKAVALIQKAVELGINFIDTADIYGRGKSEEIVGQAISPIREKVILATKGGIRITSEGKPTQDLSQNHIIKAVKESLSRLGTDYIDLYQIHYADPETPPSETIKALNEFIETGEVKYVGLSNFPPDEFSEWTEMQDVITVQLPYNLLQNKNYSELLPICRSKNISIIVYTPLLMGLLTEKIRKDNVFPENDERSRIPRVMIEQFVEIVESLKPTAKEHSKTVAQLILGWLVNQPMIGSVLVGASDVQQVEENIKAAKMNFSTDEERAIEEAIAKIGVKLDNQAALTEKVDNAFINYAGRKVALLKMGMKVVVPEYVKIGDKIAISWSGDFIGIV